MRSVQLILVCVTVISRPAGAQLASHAIGELAVRDRIRLRLVDETTLEGRLTYVDSTRVSLRAVVRRSVHEASLVDRTVPWDSIAGASVQRGTKWRTGAYVGGVAGLTFGFVGAILAAPGGLEANSDCERSCQAAYVVGGAIGGLLVGSAIGALMPDWLDFGRE